MGAPRGMIFDIDHFAVHDGPGIRTVVYVKGCPLRCAWCHSPESQSPRPEVLYIAARCRHCERCLGEACAHGARVLCGRTVDAETLAGELAEDAPFFAASGGGVSVSGGEPLMQPEFCAALLRSLTERGIHTLVETSGAADFAALTALSPYVDLFYYDIKCMDAARHRAYTGRDNARILGNLRALAELRGGAGILARLPLIPGCNDSREDVAAAFDFLAELGVERAHLLPYNASAPAKYEWLGKRYPLDIPGRQSAETLLALRALAPHTLEVEILE